MPSFDVVSDYDAHEATNGVDQANREVNTSLKISQPKKIPKIGESRLNDDMLLTG